MKQCATSWASGDARDGDVETLEGLVMIDPSVYGAAPL
jgi:hypothetical protein